MKITCYKHKSFRGVRKPTSGCPACFFVWLIQRAKKLFGFEYAKPRRQSFPGITFGVDQKPFRFSYSADSESGKHGVAGLMITEDAKRELEKIRAAVPVAELRTPNGLFLCDADGKILEKKVEPPFDRCDG